MAVSSDPSDFETRLAGLENPVRMVFFTQTFGCDTCLMTRQVIDQVAVLSEQITVEEYNLVLDREKAEKFRVDRAPAIAVVGETDIGIRHYGFPAGHEFGSLIDAVMLVGTGDVGLTEKSLERIATVDRPINIKIFVTPT